MTFASSAGKLCASRRSCWLATAVLVLLLVVTLNMRHFYLLGPGSLRTSNSESSDGPGRSSRPQPQHATPWNGNKNRKNGGRMPAMAGRMLPQQWKGTQLEVGDGERKSDSQAAKNAKATGERAKGGGLKRRLPNAVLIGVKKGGTRALIEMLDLHPQVRASGREIHFFDRDLNYDMGLDWYRGRMVPSLDGDITIEKSPAYFVKEGVPERMRRDLGPDIRLLLVLRNPVDRVVSDFMQGQHHKQGRMVRLNETGPAKMANMQRLLAKKVLKASGEINPNANFITVGMYAKNLRRWLRHFSKEQIFITSTDELVSIPAHVLKEAGKFLGLAPFDWDSRIIHVRDLKLACLNKTTQTSSTPAVMCMNSTKGREHIPVPAELRRKLVDYYRPHNEALFKLIGKTFDSWRHVFPPTLREMREHYRNNLAKEEEEEGARTIAAVESAVLANNRRQQRPAPGDNSGGGGEKAASPRENDVEYLLQDGDDEEQAPLWDE